MPWPIGWRDGSALRACAALLDDLDSIFGTLVEAHDWQHLIPLPRIWWLLLLKYYGLIRCIILCFESLEQYLRTD